MKSSFLLNCARAVDCCFNLTGTSYIHPHQILSPFLLCIVPDYATLILLSSVAAFLPHFESLATVIRSFFSFSSCVDELTASQTAGH